MTFQSRPKTPIQNLEELKRRLEKGQPVIVSQDGQIQSPGSKEIPGKTLPGEQGTTLKPQRWF